VFADDETWSRKTAAAITRITQLWRSDQASVADVDAIEKRVAMARGLSPPRHLPLSPLSSSRHNASKRRELSEGVSVNATSIETRMETAMVQPN